MRQTQLGSTGLTVSSIGFGGIPITRLSETDAAALVRRAVDAGINFIDTAYGYGGSEERIGRAVRGVPREQLVIATKDASTDGAMFTQHVEESLSRLGLDYVDIIQFHNVSDRGTWEAVLAPGGAGEAAKALKKQGKVRHVGVTSHNADLAAEMVASGQFETLQVPLNFVAEEAAGLIEPCRRQGMGLIGMKPFGGGAIEDGELALRFLHQFPDVVPIPGIETQAELDHVLRFAAAPQPLSSDDRRRITELKAELGKTFCHACGYCQPCPEGIAIAMLMRAKSFARRMPVEQAVRALGRHMAKIDSCVRCNQCTKRCPYKLDIPGRLVEMKAWFAEWLQTVQG